MTKEEFEAKILGAIRDSGDLMTTGDESGVEIDTHGPPEGNSTPVEGFYREGGRRFYFAATVTVSLDEFDDMLDDMLDDDDEEENS